MLKMKMEKKSQHLSIRGLVKKSNSVNSGVQKRQFVVEHLFFLALLSFSLVFYKERLHADASYYIFRALNSGSFWVEHSRLVLIFSQWLPVIGLKFGFGTKTLLLLYSVNHVLFPYVIYLISRHTLKDKTAGLLLCSLQLIGISKGFFVPMFELYYGCYLIVLFHSLIRSQLEYKLWIALALLPFILTSHPFAFVLLGLVLVYHAIDTKCIHWKIYILYSVCILIVLWYKNKFASEYEITKSKAFIISLKNMEISFSYMVGLTKYLVTYYWGLLLLGFVLTIYWLKNKNLRLVTLLLSFGVLLCMVNVAYWGFVHSRYHEQVYFPIVFTVVFPYCIYLLKHPQHKMRLFFAGILCTILVGRFTMIYKISHFFDGRTHEIENYIALAQQNHFKKAKLDETQLSYTANWSYSPESLLLSSINGPDQTVSICTLADLQYNGNDSTITTNEYLFRRWEIFSVHTLNKNLFVLDSSHYQTIVPHHYPKLP